MTFTSQAKAQLQKRIFADVLAPDDLELLETLPDSRKARFVVEHSELDETQVARRIADAAKTDFAEDFVQAENPEQIIPLKIINSFFCMPAADGKTAVAWLPDQDAAKWIVAQTQTFPQWVVVPANRLSEKLAQRFGVGAETMQDQPDAEDFADIGNEEIEEDENAAIIKFVNEIIAKAVADRATDIHIEPSKDSLSVRFRIDGNLVPVKLPDSLAQFKDAVISRVKIMARLNISEKRRPQDGRITFTDKRGAEIDIRVSSLPMLYGESVSLRLLNQKAQVLTIEDLGLLPDDSEKIAAPLARPHGIILVTGPTGSGKSTSLTAFIRKIMTPEIRIMTVEDPVEYEIDGVIQTQVQPEIGLTFSSVLRSVLRQDPDIIMVGEIRDRETADIAIRASLTGHLVLSTLHTNDAAGALTRLIDMDIEPFLIASSVEMILAQRLVRRLCSCAKRAGISPEQLASCLDALGVDARQTRFADLVEKPFGCDKCRNSGYFGRVGIFEILTMNEEIHSMVVSRKTARQIRHAACLRGMRTMQECGWELVKNGTTTLDEIMLYADLQEEKK